MTSNPIASRNWVATPFVSGSSPAIGRAVRSGAPAVRASRAVVLPGGLPGATNLLADDQVVAAVHEMDQAGKLVAAICAAPIVLARAGALEGRRYTAYPGYDERIETTGTFS